MEQAKEWIEARSTDGAFLNTGQTRNWRGSEKMGLGVLICVIMLLCFDVFVYI